MPKILQINIKIQEIQNRLSKDSYLSREYLPTSIDAKIFLTLKEQDKMPNRQFYPNFFHWYIMMRQFANRTIQIWLEKDQNHYAEDTLILQLIRIIKGKSQNDRKNSMNIQSNESNITWANNLLNNLTASVVEQKNQEDQDQVGADQKVQNIKLTSIQNISSAEIIYDLYYIMDIKIKSENKFCLQTLKEKFVSEISLRNQKYKIVQQRIQIIDMKEIDEEANINSEILLAEEREKHAQQQKNQSLQVQQALRKSKSAQCSTKNLKQIRIVFKVDKEESQLLKDKVLSWPQVQNIKCKKERRQRKVNQI